MPFQSAKAYARQVAVLTGQGLRWLVAGSWKRVFAILALASILVAAGGFFLASVGLVSISASSGHSPVTAWFLHYTMRNAVRLQSSGKVPPLNDPALIAKGAGHYETGCLACHGAPGRDQSLIVRQMTPEPPYLPPRISEWKPEELFWIVKNGIKFSAMPAWPALKREDEIWAMVAFLQQLPDMTAARYKELAHGDRDATTDEPVTPDHLRALADPLGPVLANCTRCHGEDGNGRGLGAFPKLAGQSEAYLLASLQSYASGDRHSGIMQPVAAGLDQPVLAALASHYASLPAGGETAEPAPSNESIRRGAELASSGVPERNVPSCIHCHGPKNSPRNDRYPAIAGQYSAYLKQQLELFSSEKRGGTAYAHIMHIAAHRLTPDQIQDLANYYASLSSATPPESQR